MYEIKVQKKKVLPLNWVKKTKTDFVPKQNGNYHCHTMPTELLAIPNFGIPKVWYGNGNRFYQTESLVR